MNESDRIKDALEKGGKIRGQKTAVYRSNGSIEHYARQHVELVCDDVLAVAKAFPDQNDPIAQSQITGCGWLPPGTHVVILADDAFHLIDPKTATSA